MMKQYLYVLAAMMMFSGLHGTAFAQQPADEARELLDVMRGVVRYDYLDIDAKVQTDVLNKTPKFESSRRFYDWYAMRFRNWRGESEGVLPGAVTSFLVAAPIECASVYDFGQPMEPEVSGVDTSKPLRSAIYSIPQWVDYHSIGEWGNAWPSWRVGHNGYVAIYAATRIVSNASKPVTATLEIPSRTPVIAWLNQKRVVESLEKGPSSPSVFGTRYEVTLNPGENILVIKAASLESIPSFYVFLSDAQTGKPLEFTIDNSRPVVSGKLEETLSAKSRPSILTEIVDNADMPLVERALAARKSLSREDADRVVNGLFMSDLEKTASLPVEDLEIAMMVVGDSAKGMMILEKAAPKYNGNPKFDLLYANQMLKVINAQNDTGSRFADAWCEIRTRIGTKPPADEYQVLYKKLHAKADLKNNQEISSYRDVDFDKCPDCVENLLSNYTDEMFNRGLMMDYRQAMETLHQQKLSNASRLINSMDMRLRRAVADNDEAALAQTLAEIQKQVERYLELHPEIERVWNYWLDIVSAYGVDAPGITEQRLAKYQEAGFTADAESWFERYLSICVNDYDHWLRYAKYCIGANKLDGALKAYRKAAELKPQDDTIAKRVEMLRFMTHQTDDADDSFETPYIVRKIPARHSDESSGVVMLVDNTVVRILPNGLYSKFYQVAYEVLNDANLEGWRNWDIYYSPIDEKVEIQSVTVIKKNGGINHLYATKDYDAGNEETRMFYDRRSLQIRIPDLAVGDRVEYQFKIIQTHREASNVMHFSELEYYQRGFPIEDYRYTVISPESMPVYFRHHDPDGTITFPAETQIKDGMLVTTFEKKDIPRFVGEPRMPGMGELKPSLMITSFDTWDQFVNWHNDLLIPQLKADDKIREKVKELTDGVTDPLEKVKKIYDYVVKSTRYIGLEYGIGGWKPRPAAKVFERRFGDCKDKAGLLKVMLDEAGIPTDFVLIRTYPRGNINMEYPHPFVFGHAIVYIPQFDLYLDGTAEFSGIHELPEMDQDAWTMIMKPDGTYTLRKSPRSKPEDNYQDEKYIFDLTNGTKVSYSYEMVVAGIDAARERSRFQVVELQKEHLESQLAGFVPGTHVDSVAFSDLTNYDQPVQYSAQATTSFSDLVRVDGKRWLVYPAFSSKNLTKVLAPSAKRRLPLDLNAPWRISLSVSYKLPHGARVVLPDDLVENSKFGSIEIRAHHEKDTITTDIHYMIEKTYIKPNEYDAFQAFIQKYDHRLNTQYTIEVP